MKQKNSENRSEQIAFGAAELRVKVARGETSGSPRSFLIAHWRCAENSVRASSAPEQELSSIQTFHVWLPSVRRSSAQTKLDSLWRIGDARRR
jgi:hypothetical protein